MSDKTLIRMCADIVSGHAEVMRLTVATGDHPSAAQIVAAGRVAIEGVAAMPAVTLAGMRGKARVLACLEGDHTSLAASLAEDLTRNAVV